MLLIASITSILIAKILGGRISRLGKIRYKSMNILIASVVIQSFLRLADLVSWHTRAGVIFVVMATSLFLLSYSICMNIHMAGMPYILAGVLANAAAILANDGKMPVTTGILKYASSHEGIASFLLGNNPTHQAITDSTKVRFLSDVFVAPPLLWRAFAFSIGDIAIVIGVFMLVMKTMLSRDDEIGA